MSSPCVNHFHILATVGVRPNTFPYNSCISYHCFFQRMGPEFSPMMARAHTLRPFLTYLCYCPDTCDSPPGNLTWTDFRVQS